VKAVVTAGGRIGGAYERQAGTSVKALAPIGDSTMLQRVIDALRGAGVERIAVIGGDDVRRACVSSVERFVDETPSGAQNVMLALQAWSDDDEPLLYATSDMPFVSAAALHDFLSRTPPGAVAIALAEHAAFARRFPGAPPFGIELAGERVVNGGVFALAPGTPRAVERLASAFFDARKHPWQMARLVGPAALVRFALRRLSVRDLERIAARALGVPAVAIRDCAPELAYDADTAAEYAYARAHG
jgi:CTP:molybdopterin cytidylyltransferase MocA